jgi:hypothetical protein
VHAAHHTKCPGAVHEGKHGVLCEVDADDVEETEVTLFCVGGTFYALQAKGPRAGQELHKGEIVHASGDVHVFLLSVWSNLGSISVKAVRHAHGPWHMKPLTRKLGSGDSGTAGANPCVKFPAHECVFDLVTGKEASSDIAVKVSRRLVTSFTFPASI